MAEINGRLVHKCGDHHLQMKGQDGDKAPHQHAVFQIKLEDRVLGQTNPISSMATSVFFDLTDGAMEKDFATEWCKLNEAFRRFWRT